MWLLVVYNKHIVIHKSNTHKERIESIDGHANINLIILYHRTILYNGGQYYYMLVSPAYKYMMYIQLGSYNYVTA